VEGEAEEEDDDEEEEVEDEEEEEVLAEEFLEAEASSARPNRYVAPPATTNRGSLSIVDCCVVSARRADLLQRLTTVLGQYSGAAS
jgi:hypothetical protein